MQLLNQIWDAAPEIKHARLSLLQASVEQAVKINQLSAFETARSQADGTSWRPDGVRHQVFHKAFLLAILRATLKAYQPRFAYQVVADGIT